MEIQNTLSNLFRDQRLNDCISRIAKDDAEDLKQDVFIILLTKPPSTLLRIINDGALFIYSVKIASNVYKKRYRNKIYSCGVVDIADTVVDDTTDTMIAEFQSIDKELNYPYFTELVKAIVKYGSQRKVSQATGIPVRSINQSVHLIRKHLRGKIC